jgi:hypothetical protein
MLSTKYNTADNSDLTNNVYRYVFTYELTGTWRREPLSTNSIRLQFSPIELRDLNPNEPDIQDKKLDLPEFRSCDITHDGTKLIEATNFDGTFLNDQTLPFLNASVYCNQCKEIKPIMAVSRSELSTIRTWTCGHFSEDTKSIDVFELIGHLVCSGAFATQKRKVFCDIDMCLDTDKHLMLLG